MEYKPRIVDRELDVVLRSAGAVLIEGPKASGKTATASQVARTVVRLDTDESAQRAAALDPAFVLTGDTPILLDEWQVVPTLWNHVRHAVDDRGPAKGQFILTGSSVPTDDARRHSGAGRFATIRMRPMSLAESGHSTGQISLSSLFDGHPGSSADSGMRVQTIFDLLVTGGWPSEQESPIDAAARAARDYITNICEVDISRVGHKERDPVRVRRLLVSLARNVATETSVTTLAADSGGGDGALDRGTIDEYLTTLQRLMVIEDQPAWAPHMRSRAPLRQAPKRHFVDPSLAVAALHGNPARLLGDLNWTGLLFESMVVRDLRVYAQPLGGRVLHFRDSKGLEVDAIVELADGRWGAFEVKLGTDSIERGAATLLEFARKVDTSKIGEPAALGVVTATGYGYQRKDGVKVIPIGALGP